MSNTSTAFAPLTPLERKEMDAFRSGSATIRKAIGWKRMLELVRPMIEATDAVMAVGTDEAKRQGLPEYTLGPMSILKIEGLSWERFMKGFHPLQEMSVEMDYFMSPDHLIFHPFEADTDGFPAGSALLVEPWDTVMIGTLVSALDPVKDKEYTDTILDKSCGEGFGFCSRSIQTGEPKSMTCTQLIQADKGGFTARRGGLSRTSVMPQGKTQDHAAAEAAERAAKARRAHGDLEYYRAIEYMREMAKADRDSGRSKDEDFEYLNVPLSLTWDDRVMDANQMDHYELAAHRRFAPLMEKALKLLQK